MTDTLNIKIHLEGDIKNIVNEYKYSVNTNPESKQRSIYVPTKTFIGNKDVFKTSDYPKNPIEIFLSTTKLTDFLTNRPEIFKKQSKLLDLSIREKTKELKLINSIFNSNQDDVSKNKLTKEINDIREYINTSNQSLILSLLFNKNMLFYFKNIKYKIIKNYEFFKQDLSNNLEDYHISENELINDLVSDLSNNIYTNSYDELEFNLKNKKYNKIQDASINELYNPPPNVTISDLTEKKKTVIDNFKKNLSEKAGKEATEYIEKHKTKIINTIIKTMNDDMKIKKKNIRYTYIKYKGLIASYINNSKLIEIKLNIENIDTKKNIYKIYNCKTRKKKISSLYNKLFEIKSLKEQLSYEASGYYLYHKYINLKNNINVDKTYSEWIKFSNNKKNLYIDIAKILHDDNNIQNLKNKDDVEKLINTINNTSDGITSTTHATTNLTDIQKKTIENFRGFILFCKYINKTSYKTNKNINLKNLYNKWINLSDTERLFYNNLINLISKNNSSSNTTKKRNLQKYYNIKDINENERIEKMKALLKQDQLVDRNKFMMDLLNP